MSFTQAEFAALLPIVFFGWLVVRNRYAIALAWLLAGSLFFYGFRQWWVLSVILGYCLVDWLTGIWLQRTQRRRLVLAAGVGFNLLVLCFWKYTPLLVETMSTLLGWKVIRLQEITSGHWVIPMGISFYAFTGIAYMVDVYRGTIAAETSLWRYALFTSFFPHLVAGPILRPSEFLAHLRPGAMPTQAARPGRRARS